MCKCFGKLFKSMMSKLSSASIVAEVGFSSTSIKFVHFVDFTMSEFLLNIQVYTSFIAWFEATRDSMVTMITQACWQNWITNGNTGSEMNLLISWANNSNWFSTIRVEVIMYNRPAYICSARMKKLDKSSRYPLGLCLWVFRTICEIFSSIVQTLNWRKWVEICLEFSIQIYGRTIQWPQWPLVTSFCHARFA